MKIDLTELKINRIKLNPGEKLLVKAPEETSDTVMGQIVQHMTAVFGAGNFLLFMGDIEFTKVTPPKGASDGKSG